MSEHLPPQSPPVDRAARQWGQAADDVSRQATVRTADGQVMTVAAAVAAAVLTQRNTCPAESPSGICLGVRG
jgi:hypothetical protein